MPWWGWIIIGIVLLCAELFAIDAQFFLVFIGIGALIVGLGQLLGLDLPMWGQWLLFAALSVGAMFTLRRQLYEKLRMRAVGTAALGVGDSVVIAEELSPGSSCRTEYRGSTWTCVNIGENVIPAGANARIDMLDGLTLRVRGG